MSREIINYDDEDYHGLLVNTFWGGKEECVQFTEGDRTKGYVTMTREEAIQFVGAVYERLIKQIEEDRRDPPWWQASP